MTPNADTSAVALGLTTLVVIVALYVWTALALAAVFRKSGEEGWKAWVPIYNQAVLFRLGGYTPMLLLLYLAVGPGALAVWIVQILACARINAAFRFGPGMTVLAALVFPVWATIIGFGSARWVGEESGPRRSGDAPPPPAPPRPPAPSPTAGFVPPPPAGSDGAFHGRSTHIAPADPLYVTSPEAVAPPAPAPGRPTPFAPTAPPAPPAPGTGVAAEGPPVAPRAARTGSPIDPPPGGWAPEEVGDEPQSPSPWQPPVIMPEPAGEAFAESAEVTGAVPGAPEPRPANRDGVPPALPPVTRTPPMAPRREGGEPWAPSRSAMPESEAFAESSGPVSAIAGSPDAGSPRAARSSVSAQSRRPQIPDDPLDHTIIARRRRTDWSIVTPEGDTIAIGSDVVLLGRRPAVDPAHPSAQLVSIDDGTVSKTHARLHLRDDTWYVTDLGSTNGVVFATVLGTEVEATPGVEIEAGDRFLLGDAEVRLVRSTG